MTSPLAAFSEAIATVVASVAPLLCAIRTGPNRHITGLLYAGGVIATVDQALPMADGYTVVLADRSLASVRPGLRDPASNLAVVHLDTSVASFSPSMTVASPGSIALVLGADADASPTVRLTVVHRLLRTAEGAAPVLDLPIGSIGQGDPVMDANGHLIGIGALGPHNEAMVIPSDVLARVISPGGEMPVAQRPAIPAFAPASSRRGWLGVALQPINIPDQLIARAGQTSGRMVVSITPGGPADQAGLRVNDVLLALNETSTTGPNALRAFLAADRIGSKVEARVMREGNVLVTQLIVGAQPN